MSITATIITNLLTAAIVGPLGYLIRRWKEQCSDRRRLQRVASRLGSIAPSHDTLSLAADPEEILPGRLHTATTANAFVIPFPDNLISSLRSVEQQAQLEDDELLELHDGAYLGCADAALLFQSTEIDDLATLVASAAQDTARAFIDRRKQAAVTNPDARGRLFNNWKYGLSSYDAGLRDNTHAERLILRLTLFKTDYFTSCVMRKVHRSLAGRPQFCFDWTDPTVSLKRYRPFVCGFGLNAVLICRGSGALSGERVLFLTQRSNEMTLHPGHFHISMNEALSEADEEQGQVSIKNGFERGFLEELGLKRDEIGDVHICDFALAMDHLAVFLTAWCETDLDFETIKQRPARDKALEISKYTQLPMDRASIREAVKTTLQPMVPHGLFTLERIVARQVD